MITSWSMQYFPHLKNSDYAQIKELDRYNSEDLASDGEEYDEMTYAERRRVEEEMDMRDRGLTRRFEGVVEDDCWLSTLEFIRR